jgi:PAS domain S-box-containing protein
MGLEKKFSRYILKYLMLFMGASFIIAALVTYFIRVAYLEKENEQALAKGQKGFSDTLNIQFDYVGEAIDHIVTNDMIKKYILDNDLTLLSELIKARYSFESKMIVIIRDDRTGRFIPELSQNLEPMRPLFEELRTRGKIHTGFKKTGEKQFATIYSTPITHIGRHIGTGYLLYDISKDRNFWEIVNNMRGMLNPILINDNGAHLYNIETGEEATVPDKTRFKLLTGKSPVQDIVKDATLLPMTGFQDVYYEVNDNWLVKQKASLRNILFILCILILILTWVLSFFIARVVSRPLEGMAREAIDIAHNPRNKFLREDSNEYYEFRQLSHAFNQVLSSLFKAQEELKSEARKELEASEERYRLTVETAPDTIVITKENDGRILYINKAGERMFGYAKDDATGKTVFDLNAYSDYSDRKKIVNSLESNIEVNRMEVKFKRKDGRIMDCFMSSRRIKYQGEDCIISVITDHSELKKAEEEKIRLESALQRASKMEAIGTMAGGIAHDLNNILSGLVGYPELMLMDIPEDSRLRKPLLTIQKSGEKAAAIVQDMLTLARRGVTITEVVNLNNTIRDYLASPEHQRMMSYHSDVTLSANLEPNLMNIIGSDVHLSKTLMNLISNAMEAMPAGGKIDISTENEYIDAPVKGYDDVNEGDYVVLTVSDNGTGISVEDQERIFEPFYTKKKMGRSGTGLGMAVVWGTVKDHNGYIDLQSNINNGSKFKLYFPVTRKELIEADSSLSIETYMGRGESILVVDDVKEQREIASNMLTRLGYAVASVSSGEEAVEYMKHNSSDILMLDMIMAPGIDGLETYKKVLAMHPGQKAIVASGFSETERVRETQRLGAGAYVKKPYLLKNIGPAVRRELDKKN